jgi:hypothetical protein
MKNDAAEKLVTNERVRESAALVCVRNHSQTHRIYIH